MRRQLELWHLLVGLVVTIVIAASTAWSTAVGVGRDNERLRLTQELHAQRITKLETTQEIDRKEVARQYDLLNSKIYEILLILKDKENRQ